MNISLKIIAFSIVFTAGSLRSSAQGPKLIEFGWDYPDVDQLSKGLPSMQNAPFDGICFSLQRTIMEAFDTAVHNEKYFEYDKLKTLQWGKYSSNFIILRGFGITGGRWFDDSAWNVFTANMVNLSKAMSIGRIKGVLFDPEYYYKDPLYNPWTYTKTQYPDQSFEEVQAAVKKRGCQFIIALQKYKVNLNVLSLWLASLVAEDIKASPLQGTRHALLLSFFEGMLERKNQSVKIIEGNEYAYWFKKPSEFLQSGKRLKTFTVEQMRSKKAKSEVKNITISQPLFYDGLLARAPLYEKGYDNAAKWKWMEENTRYAMATSDKYVWFYSQSINWWKGNVNDTLVQILQNCKTAFNSNTSLKKDASPEKKILSNSTPFNEEKGYYYITDPKTPMKTGEVAFTFKWDPLTKTLLIDFGEKIPQTLTIFTNNTSSEINNVKKSRITFKTKDFNKGKIMVLAKYETGLEASGIQLYSSQ